MSAFEEKLWTVHDKYEELNACERLLEKVGIDWKSMRTAYSQLERELTKDLDCDDVRHEQQALELR